MIRAKMPIPSRGRDGAAFPIEAVRARFPALALDSDAGRTLHFDTPGGTQICGPAIERMHSYLSGPIANAGGLFETSAQSETVIARAREGVADLIGATPKEIGFGPNMTSLAFAVSRALAREWGHGDELVVTRLDHDANIMPWLEAAKDRGMKVRWLDFDPASGTLRLDQLETLLGPRTRLVAFTAASNALGTLVPVARAARIVREHSSALIFVDAVQSVPHVPTDVAALGCDFLVWSAYKFFGPHLGVLWARASALDKVRAYKARPARGGGPRRFETGALSFEGLAALVGMIEHLEWLGGLVEPEIAGRRARLGAAMRASHAYETLLSEKLLAELEQLPGFRLHGPRARDPRVPTFGFTIDGLSPDHVARSLGERRVNIWSGNFYAVEAIERLGLADRGGLIRVGLCHYHSLGEVEELMGHLRELVGREAPAS